MHEVYFDELHVSAWTVATKLKMSPSTFIRLLNGTSSVTPEMALRLSKTLGRTTQKAGWRCKTITTSGSCASD